MLGVGVLNACVYVCVCVCVCVHHIPETEQGVTKL